MESGYLAGASLLPDLADSTMAVDEYRQKRHFDKTPEPSGGHEVYQSPAIDSGRLRFVLQKHAARRLHYDLRLEWNGVLLSWAIPKGPSLDPEQKRLAIHVEDHPIEYCEFEGIIPDHEYGGGTVLIWDFGTWQPLAANGYEQGELKFELRGQKLQGRWMLVHTGKRGRDPKHWLLFKERDEAACPAASFDVLIEHPNSALTGRTLEEIAASSQGAPLGGSSRRDVTAHATPTRAPDAIRGARPRDMPTTAPRPMLPTATREAPSGDAWLHEIKLDGYRMICLVREKQARFVSRNGNDWTSKLPTLAKRMAELPVEQAIFDGEVAALAVDGTTDFQALQNTIGRGHDQNLKYYLFDLLYLNGYDLTGARLDDRKRQLEALLPASDNGSLQFSEHIVGNGPTVFEHACRLGAEGIVSKRADRKYVSSRTTEWLKTKSLRSAEFVVGGYTESTTSRYGFGSLILGAYEGEDLIYLGRVGTGFSDQTRELLSQTLAKLRSDKNLFVNLEAHMIERKVYWIDPQLVAEVEFGGWTEDTVLRFPSFRGIRSDIEPSQVITSQLTNQAPSSRDVEVPDDRVEINERCDSVPLGDIGQLNLTHPDRVMYPDCGVTKLAVAIHYLQVAEAMLPHVINRPLALVRCPKGTSHRCFFQKRRAKGMPEAVHAAHVSRADKGQDVVFVRDLAGLMALVQFSVLEVHIWGARMDRPDRPDRLIFDLDPDVSLSFARVCAAAREVRSVLESLGLVSFVKTTGGKGLHVVVPIRRTVEWPTLRDFAARLAARIEGVSPTRYTTNASKRARHGKIYIDHLRNSFGATSVAPFSTRARPGATVSTPVAWDELDSLRSADCYTVANIQRRLSHQRSDPWAEINDVTQAITKSMIRSIGG